MTSNYDLLRRLELYGLTLLGLFNVTDDVTSLIAFSHGFIETNAFSMRIPGIQSIAAANMAALMTALIMVVMAYVYVKARNKYIHEFIMFFTWVLMLGKLYATIHNISIL